MEQAKRVVGYIRVSTDTQAEEGYSLDNQKSVIERDCNLRGWELVEVFADEGKTGSSLNERNGMADLLRYVKRNEIDYVMVFKVSRLSRKISDALYIVEELESFNCSLISIKDSIDTSTPMGKYFLTFGAIFAEMERENIITQVRGGMEQKARDGEWNGGKPPLGYDLVEKEVDENEKRKVKKVLIINEEEAEIVKRVFELYLSGKGYKSIAEQLNTKGHKTKRGNLFSGNAVKDILKNPIYYGIIRWGFQKDWGKKQEGKRKRVYNNEPILRKGKHEAIITKEVFDTVQERITSNPRHHVKQFNGNHLLSGLLKCPYCHEYSMSIQRTRDSKSGKEYEYYICNQYQTYKRCSAKGVRKDDIEFEFLKIFEAKMSQPNILNAMLSNLNNPDKQVESIQKDLAKINETIKTLTRKVDNLTNTLAEGELVDGAKSALLRNIEKYSNEIESLEIEMGNLTKQKNIIKESQLDIVEIEKVLKNVGKVIRVLDKPKQQSLIRMVVEKITVKDGHIKDIYFKFEKGLKFNVEVEQDDSLLSQESFRGESDMVNRIISKCGF